MILVIHNRQLFLESDSNDSRSNLARKSRIFGHTVEDGFLVFEERSWRVKLGNSSGVKDQHPENKEKSVSQQCKHRILLFTQVEML